MWGMTVASIRRGWTNYDRMLYRLINTGYRLNILALPLLLSDCIYGDPDPQRV